MAGIGVPYGAPLFLGVTQIQSEFLIKIKIREWIVLLFLAEIET